MATAMDANVDQFDTYDGPLIALSGKVGNPPLVIGKPNLPETLFDQVAAVAPSTGESSGQKPST